MSGIAARFFFEYCGPASAFCVRLMKTTKIHIEKGDALQQLMPILEGKVFHVSKSKNWPKIEELEKIIPNENGDLETSFGASRNSFFKNKDCVSVFDYRNIHEDKPQEHMYKCRPTAPLTPEEGIVIFVLSETTYSNLIPWEGWKQEDLSQMVVPYVEAGYPGAIELSLIDEVIFVTMDENESSGLANLLRSMNNVQD